MKKKYIIGSLMLSALLPSVAFAVADVEELILEILYLLNLIIPVIFGLALVYFLWGLAQFILNAGNETARESARSIMIWGIIALFVMVSVWGLVNLLTNTFGLDTARSSMPSVGTGGGGSGGDSSGGGQGDTLCFLFGTGCGG